MAKAVRCFDYIYVFLKREFLLAKTKVLKNRNCFLALFSDAIEGQI